MATIGALMAAPASEPSDGAAPKAKTALPVALVNLFWAAGLVSLTGTAR